MITEEQVAEALSLADVIDALALSLVREYCGQAVNISKTVATWDPASSAHALGAVDHCDHIVCFKTWVNTPDGARAVVTLFDSRDARVIATMSANVLGSLRTAAIVGLATRHMSDPSSDRLAVIGSGRQALQQIRAIATVRSLREVTVWSPNTEHRQAFADEVTTKTGIRTVACGSVEEAVDSAPIVTLITRAREPVLFRGQLAPGAHLNAVGAVLPANAEFEPMLLADAERVVVDNLENARRSSRELREYFGDDLSPVSSLGASLAEPPTDRPKLESAGISVFKSMGMGLADLAAAAAVARALGLLEGSEQQS